MTSGLIWVMIAMSFVSLIGFGFSGLLVSQAQGRRQKSKQRMRDLIAPYRKSYATPTEVFRPAVKSNKSLAESAANVFGFHLNTVRRGHPVHGNHHRV